MEISLYPLSAVIFDCDGVLVDSEPLHYQAFQDVLRPLDLGHDYEHYLKHYIGFDDRDAFIEVFREAQRPLDAAHLGRLIGAKEQALQRILSKGISTFPGVVALVNELARYKVPLAVASGALRHEVLHFVDALGLGGAFRIVVAADDVARSKPDPESYLLALHRLREHLGLRELEPGRCIAIEDTPAGIRSAKGAGLIVVGVAHSYPPDELHGADRVLENLTGLNLPEMIKLVEERTSTIRR